jgi:hypothetical protein
MTSYLDQIPRENLWAAVFGASVARYAHDQIERGEGPPDDAAMDNFVEESEAIADLALKSWDKLYKK